MTRIQEIASLRQRIALAQAQRKNKTALLLQARLRSLITRQLNAEIKLDRKAS